MNAPSRWLRPLQAVAVALGLLAVALLLSWLQQEPGPPAAGAPAAPVAPADAPPVAAAREQTDAPVAPAATAIAPADAVASAASAVLYGTVRRADGTPVPSGHLWLYRDGENVGSASLARGTFAFAGLQPGSHRLDSRIEDELPVQRAVEVAAPRTRLDLQLGERWLLTVNAVTPEGTPLLEALQQQAGGRWPRGLTALAFAEPLAGDLPPTNQSTVEAGLGRFASPDMFRSEKPMPKQTLGVLTLPPDRPVHVALLLRSTLIAQQPAAPGQGELTFVLGVEAVTAKTATVHVRLVDGSGAPVAGARVSFHDAQSGGGGQPTDADGRITLTHLRPGLLDLEIWHQELRGPPVQVEVRAGTDVDLGDVTMLPGTKVAFAFDNFAGNGSVRGQWLEPMPRTGFGADDVSFSAETAKVQEYALFPGRYAFLARSTAGVALVEIDTRALPGQPVRFPLQPGAPLLLRNQVGEGLVQLRLRHRSGLEVFDRELTGTSEYAITLPPGDYTAELTGMGGTTTQRAVVLSRAGAVLTIP